MKLNVFNQSDEAIQALAEYFIAIASDAIAQKGRFDVSLSGGSSPKKLYALLSDKYAETIDWSKVFFFFGDERFVPHDHPDSNFLMADQSFFTPLAIAEEQVYKVDTGLDPASAALDYQRCICRHFENEPVFDLVLLGLGDDAHTASIFPNTSLVWIDEELVKEVYLEDKEIYRISMTAPLINAAKNIAFLTFGSGKANAVKAVIEGDRDIQQYPAQLIKPCEGNLEWFIDEAAAGNLSQQ